MSKPKRNDPRINLTFYDDHLAFCREMAWQRHQSVTAYVNGLIAAEMSKQNNIERKCSSFEKTK